MGQWNDLFQISKREPKIYNVSPFSLYVISSFNMEAYRELLGDFPQDLLPSGTKIFPSQFSPSHKVRNTMVALIVIVSVLLAVGFSLEGKISTILLISAFLLSIIGLCVLFKLTIGEMIEYRERVKDDSFLSGVFLFPSGDIVVRQPSTLSHEGELQIAANTVNAVSIHHSCSWSFFLHTLVQKLLTPCFSRVGIASSRISCTATFIAIRQSDQVGRISCSQFIASHLSDKPIVVAEAILEFSKKHGALVQNQHCV